MGKSHDHGLLFLLLCTHGPVLAEYPQNYVSENLGAIVTTTSALTGPFGPNALRSDGPVSKGRFAFSAVDQRRTFTVDFGRPRTFDRIQLGTAGNPAFCAVEISSTAIDGPFQEVHRTPSPGHLQTLRVPLVNARWVRFGFGRSARRTGVHSVRIFRGYKHLDLAEVTRRLHARLKLDLTSLAGFRSHVSAANWRAASGELRSHFASTHKPESPPNPAYDLTRARSFAAGELNFAGLSRTDSHPIDWAWMKTTDWYEHKNFLNRGSPLGVLADACYHTGDSRWAGIFSRIFYDWVDENPKPDIMSRADYPTWRTLDTAARLSWLISRFAEVTASREVDDELWGTYLYSIWEHADYLKNDNFSGGNWLATITSAVTHVAQQFPEFRDRGIWLEYGKTAFEKNVLRDIFPDGKEMEDAPGYVCMAYKAMLATLESLDQEGIRVQPEVRARLNRVQDFLAAATQPNGLLPSIGDWGGCEPYALPVAMKHFKRDDIRYVLSRGQSGVSPSRDSVHFPHGGWSVMRSPYTERPYEHARHLVFKASSGPHGHLDVLSVTAYAFGRELVIDPGIRSYEHADVQRYLQTSYHNTVCVDRQNQPRVPGKIDRWFSSDALDCVSGTFAGYPNLLHRRMIFFVRPDYWYVRDQITGSGDHTYDQNWHCAADARLTLDAQTKRVRTTYAAGGNLLFLPVNFTQLECEFFDYYIATKRMSSGKANTPARGFKYWTTGAPPKTFEILLYPYLVPSPPSISAERLAPDSASSEMIASRITIDKNADYIFVAPNGPTEVSVADGKIRIHAELLLIRTTNGKPTRVSGKNVRNVVFFGETLVPE